MKLENSSNFPEKHPTSCIAVNFFCGLQENEKVIPMLSVRIFDIVMTSPSLNLKAIIVPGVLRPFPNEGHVLCLSLF